MRHQHHSLVTGRVAVRMVFTQHVTHGAGRLLVLGAGRQPQLTHGVNNPPLHGLEAVADVRQGAIHDHVHGIVEVGLLGKGRQRATLYAIQAQVQSITHAFSPQVGNAGLPA